MCLILVEFLLIGWLLDVENFEWLGYFYMGLRDLFCSLELLYLGVDYLVLVHIVNILLCLDVH